jgi:hypothetical protein
MTIKDLNGAKEKPAHEVKGLPNLHTVATSNKAC